MDKWTCHRGDGVMSGWGFSSEVMSSGFFPPAGLCPRSNSESLGLDIIFKHVPSKTSTKRVTGTLHWLTPQLRKAINRKNTLQPEGLNNLNCGPDIRHINEKHNRIHGKLNDIILKGLSSNDNKPFWKYIKAKRQLNGQSTFLSNFQD